MINLTSPHEKLKNNLATVEKKLETKINGAERAINSRDFTSQTINPDFVSVEIKLWPIYILYKVRL